MRSGKGRLAALTVFATVILSSVLSLHAQQYTTNGQTYQNQPQQGVGQAGQSAYGPTGQVNAAPNAAPNGANRQMMPQPFRPLSPEHEKYLDQLLTYWEVSSTKIKHYQCKFTRWQYDGVFGPKQADPQTGEPFAKSIATGVIRYATPDKGMYQVDELWAYDPKATPQPYSLQDSSQTEKWICDGKAIFEFDNAGKRLIERQLPPSMQGEAISHTTKLPFFFGAKKSDMLSKYWIQVTTPEGAEGEYWLEAYPKRREDALDWSKVEVVLDEKDFLPKALKIFDANYHPQTNPTSQTFVFAEREYNWSMVLQKLNLFHREFYKPPTPSGFEHVVQKHDELIQGAASTAAGRPQANGAPGPNNQGSGVQR